VHVGQADVQDHARTGIRFASAQVFRAGSALHNGVVQGIEATGDIRSKLRVGVNNVYRVEYVV
jgi:hypothetical protein